MFHNAKFDCSFIAKQNSIRLVPVVRTIPSYS